LRRKRKKGGKSKRGKKLFGEHWSPRVFSSQRGHCKADQKRRAKRPGGESSVYTTDGQSTFWGHRPGDPQKTIRSDGGESKKKKRVPKWGNGSLPETHVAGRRGLCEPRQVESWENPDVAMPGCKGRCQKELRTGGGNKKRVCHCTGKIVGVNHRKKQPGGRFGKWPDYNGSGKSIRKKKVGHCWS